MSFGAPAYLAALALVPLAVAAYVAWERRRRAGAREFASPALMPAVAPRRPGRGRHVPVALYLVALAVLALALARPERTVAVEEERATVILVTDVSGSMQATDVAPSRLAAAQDAALAFLDDAPERLRVGLVTFSDRVLAVEPPGPAREPVAELVERIRAQGGTATGDALATALRAISAERDGDERPGGERRPPAAIVLLSDGASTSGRDPLAVARDARRARVPIHTVALGTPAGTIEVERRDGSTVTEPVPPDLETLERIARTTGGQTFETAGADELEAVYDQLGSSVATREEKRQVTAAFAGGGAALLLLGGLASLALLGRLP